MFKAKSLVALFTVFGVLSTYLASTQIAIAAGSPEYSSSTFDCTPRPNADLRGCDYTGMLLENTDFSGSNLSFADFTKVTMRGVNFSGANVYGSTWPYFACESCIFTGTKSGAVSGGVNKSPDPNLEFNPFYFVGGYLVTEGVDLSGAKLAGADFTNIVLKNVDFTKANLESANFSGSWMENINFTEVLARKVAMVNTRLKNVNFSKADMTESGIGSYAPEIQTYLDSVNFTSANFRDAFIGGADIKNSNFENVNFANATAQYVRSTNNYGNAACDGKNFRVLSSAIVGPKSFIRNASFAGMDLRGIDFSEVGLVSVDFSGANLIGAKFNKSGLTSVNFRGANLTDSDFSNSSMNLGAQTNSPATSFVDANLTRLKSGGIEGMPELPAGWIFANGAIIGPTANLSKASISGSFGLSLANIDLSEANLYGIRARGFAAPPTALPEGWIFAGGALVGPGVDLDGLNLEGVDLSQANFKDVGSSYTGGAPSALPEGWIYTTSGLFGPGVRINSAGTFRNFDRINLAGSSRTGGDISLVNFSSSDLTGVKWSGLTNRSTANLPAKWKVVNGYLVGPTADLSGANFKNANFDGLDLSDAQLTNVSSGGITGRPTALPSGWKLLGGYLLGPSANLEFSTLVGLDLNTLDLSSATLTGVKSVQISGTPILPSGWELIDGFITCKCETYNFSNLNLSGANLSNLNLSRLGVISGKVVGSPILPEGWRLANGYLIGPGALLQFANLSNLDLSNQDFTGADVTFVDFSYSNLSNAVFNGTYINSANFFRANLSNSKFRNVGPYSGSDFTFKNGNNFYLANIDGAEFISSQIYGNLTTSSTGMPYIENSFLNGFYRTDILDVCGVAISRQAATSNLTIENCQYDEIDLSGISLTDVKVTNSNIGRIKLGLETIQSLTLSNSNVRLFQSTNTKSPEIKFDSVQIYRFEAAGVEFAGLEVADSTIFKTKFESSDIRGIQLTRAQFVNLAAPHSTLKSTGVVDSRVTDGWALVGEYLLGPQVDVSNADFSGLRISDVDLSDANLTNVNFSNALVSNVDFSRGALDNSVFSGATLENVDFSDCGLNGARLSMATFNNVKAFRCYANTILPSGWFLNKGYLLGPTANLESGDLTGVNINAINLRGANLNKIKSSGLIGTPTALPQDWVLRGGMLLGPTVNLSNTKLSNFSIAGLNLSGANLDGFASSNLTGKPAQLPDGWILRSGMLLGPKADLSRANLQGLDLSQLDLSGANFANSNLTNANLAGTNLDQANFIGSELSGAYSTGILGTPLNLPKRFKLVKGCIVGPYFRSGGCDLSGMNIEGLDLIGADIRGVKSGGITGNPASLPKDTQLINGYLVGPGVDLRDANFEDCCFIYSVNLEGANLSTAKFKGSMVIVQGTPASLPSDWKIVTNSIGWKYLVGPGVRLIDANLAGTDLTGVDLSGSSLERVSSGQITGIPLGLPDGYRLTKGHLVGPGTKLTTEDSGPVNLRDSNLSELLLKDFDAENVDFSQSQISSAIFSNSKMGRSAFRGTNLSSSVFSNTDLSGVDFTGANLTGAEFINVKFDNVISSGVLGVPKTLPTGYTLQEGAFVRKWTETMQFNIAPIIQGDYSVGSTLQYSGFEFDSATQLTFQWLIDGRPISKAISRTYTIQSTDYGKKISLSITGKKPGFEVVSAVTPQITLPVPSLRILSTSATGEFRTGKSVKLTVKLLNNFGAISYQWQADGKPLKGATSPNFVIPKTLKGKKVTCLVTVRASNLKPVTRITAPILVR